MSCPWIPVYLSLLRRIWNKSVAIIVGLLVMCSGAASAQAASTIDILVGYTNAALQHSSSRDQLLSKIETGITNANQTYTNNALALNVNLAGVIAVAGYDEASKSTGDVLDDLAGNDPHLDILKTRREQLGADAVMLVIYNDQDTAKDGTDCGVSFQSPGASQAFSVLYEPCVGSPELVLAHELGHIIGAGHEDGAAATYAWGHGFQDPANQFRTVMAGDCAVGQTCERVPYWSSAKTQYPIGGGFGVPLGNAETYNNERVLGEHGSDVAGFGQSRPANFMFVSYYAYEANFGGLTGADAKCQQEAYEFGLPGEYLAWLSTAEAGQTPASRFTKSTLPYITTDNAGTELAADWTALITSGPQSKILDASGQAADAADLVWSTTGNSGEVVPYTGAYSCKAWTDIDADQTALIAYYGPPFPAGTNWTGSGNVTACDSKLRLYCVQQ